MPDEKLKAFLETVKANEGLQNKIKTARGPEDIRAIAKEAGFELSRSDLLRHQAMQTLAINDDELEGVCGGAVNNDGRQELVVDGGAGVPPQVFLRDLSQP